VRIKKNLIKEVLKELYEEYFPDADYTRDLSKALGTGEEDGGPSLDLEAALLYLEDKGLVARTEHGRRITAEGIDKLEGGSLI